MPVPAYFYPRSPCGERPNNRTEQQAQHDFYPRSPCGERRSASIWFDRWRTFLSTLSLRRATCWRCHSRRPNIFLSTLSLRRATAGRRCRCQKTCNFYPRSPCGERQQRKKNRRIKAVFLSTLSLRRATPSRRSKRSPKSFLSTLSLRRATCRI